MGENCDRYAAAQLCENKHAFYKMLCSNPWGKPSRVWCCFKAQCLGNMMTDTVIKPSKHAINIRNV